jgi:hypothetical protein
MVALLRRAKMEELRGQYRHNLHILELQIAQSGGPSNASLKLLNDLEMTRDQIGGLDRELANLGAAPAAPYRGLRPFDVADTGLFFGRHKLVESLTGLLDPAAERPRRFLALVGPSGSGKSSLARAGLLGALRQNTFFGSADWPQVIWKPGSEPLENLALALSEATGDGRVGTVRDLLAELRRDPASLHLAVRLALRSAPADRRLVLLVDQFEELFTLCADEHQRNTIIASLLHAVAAPEGRTVVVLTLRSDFYGACASYPALAEALSASQRLVGPLTPEEMREAIEKPCEQAGASFEDGLVDLLLRDVVGEPGALPLLQYALQELWLRRTDATLTHEAYRTIGGVFGTLSQRAEVVYNSFDPTQQEICRSIFLQLVHPGEDTGDVRRRVRYAALLPLANNRAAFDVVIKRLTDEQTRLLILGGPSPRQGDGPLADTQPTAHPDSLPDPDAEALALRVLAPPTVEIAHEALIRNWFRLQKWLEDSRAALLVRQRLQAAAQQWEVRTRAHEFLYGPLQLADVARSFADADLDASEQAFIRESRSAQQLGWMRRAALATGALLLALALGFAGLRYERDTRWVQVVNGPQGRVWHLAAQSDPAPRYYIATANWGVFHSTGTNWLDGRTGLPQETEPATGDPLSNVRDTYLVVPDQQDSLRIFTYVPDRGMYRSDDGGNIWQPHPSPSFAAPETDLRSLSVHSQLMVAVDTASYLYVSVSGGVEWLVIDDEEFALVYAAVITPDGAYIDVAAPKGLYRCAAPVAEPALKQCALLVPVDQLSEPEQGIRADGDRADSVLIIHNLRHSARGDGVLYFIAADERDRSAIFRWQPPTPPQRMANFALSIIDLTPDPSSDSAYALLANDEVWWVGTDWAVQLDPQPTGRANALLAAPRPDGGTWLLLGNERGVWEYRRSLR